jgi:hypothetical protein
VLVATLIRNLCLRAEFARALNNPQRRFQERIKRLRDSTARRSDDSENGEVSRMIMFTSNTLAEFKTNEERAAAYMSKLQPLEPMTAEVMCRIVIR